MTNEWRKNLQKLFNQGRFCDVTLACKGGHTIGAHKIIICAYSNYLNDVLKVESTDTIIIMKDCEYEDIKEILYFMYQGELNVPQVSIELNNFNFNTNTENKIMVFRIDLSPYGEPLTVYRLKV